MNKLITLAIFDNPFNVAFNLLKDMLDEAGIHYFVSNENSRTVKPMPAMTPTNLSIDIKIYENDVKEAVEILKSIKRKESI
jgi:protein associated with RNAse G/E